MGRVTPKPLTYRRISTDDFEDIVTGYVGEGRFTDDRLETFGGCGVIEVPHFQDLRRYICPRGLEHHVAATRASVAEAIEDALETYLAWEV